MMYAFFLGLILVGGIIAKCWVVYILKGEFTRTERAALLECLPWWVVVLSGLGAGLISLAVRAFATTGSPHQGFESLAIRVLVPLLCIGGMSLSGFLLLSPFNLRGLGQRMGMFMGVLMVMIVRDILRSHGLC